MEAGRRDDYAEGWFEVLRLSLSDSLRMTADEIKSLLLGYLPPPYFFVSIHSKGTLKVFRINTCASMDSKGLTGVSCLSEGNCQRYGDSWVALGSAWRASMVRGARRNRAGV